MSDQANEEGPMVRLHPGMVPMPLEEAVQRLRQEQEKASERLDRIEIALGMIEPPEAPPCSPEHKPDTA